MRVVDLVDSHVVVHDFSGHPFQVQLARHLASPHPSAPDGIRTTHVYCPSFLTPRGNVDDTGDSQFQSIGVALRKPFEKYSGPKRFLQEIEYGWRLSREMKRQDPDVIVSANTPLLAALVFQIAMKLRRRPIVFWQQDVYSEAMSVHLSERFGFVGRLAGWFLLRVETWLLRSSQRVVVISDAFLDTLRDWKVDLDVVDVVENWAPLDELPVRPRPNPWSERHGVTDDQTVFLYAGTLGLKHEPSLLLDVARTFRDRPDVRVIVASEGVGAQSLADDPESAGSLEQLPFQPYEDLPDMLATADVLMVLLEADAGGFSVPSKVLTYHCAGRAILGSMPLENLASMNIANTGSGVVVPAGDSDAFVAAAVALADDPERRVAMGEAARSYAERVFDIGSITARFEQILAAAMGIDVATPVPEASDSSENRPA